MTKREHMLTIVEPTTGGDSTLDLAHDTVERGGTTTVLMLITERVQRDIREFAEAENLGRGEAEARALDQFVADCVGRIGGSPRIATYFGELETALQDNLTGETTAIAIPERFAGRWVRRLASTTGVPVIITPSRAA